MNKTAQKTASTCFLGRTVAEYIKCLFNSSKSLEKLSLKQLVDRINADIELIRNVFNEYMTAREMQKSLDYLNDLINIFSAEPDFLALAFTNLSHHLGPCVNQHVIKRLINFRTDLGKKIWYASTW